MISIDGLTVEFSGTTLFKDISFTIGDKDRIALMGKNGAGKSTLLKIIAGVRSATRGRVTVGEGGKVGYLPQHLQVEDGRTPRRRRGPSNTCSKSSGGSRRSTSSSRPAPTTKASRTCG